MSEPLFRRILGAEFERLPPPLRALHDRRRDTRAVGRSRVVLGRSRVARALAQLLRLPPAGDDIALTVDFVPQRGGETWRRDFAGARLTSHLSSGRGTLAGLILERRFPITVAMRLVADAAGLSYVPRRYWLLGLPWPAALAPRTTARESVENGLFTFDIAIALPLVGPLIRYRGSLSAASGEEAVGETGPWDHALLLPPE